MILNHEAKPKLIVRLMWVGASKKAQAKPVNPSAAMFLAGNLPVTMSAKGIITRRAKPAPMSASAARVAV